MTKGDHLYDRAIQFYTKRFKPIMGAIVEQAVYDESEYGEFYIGLQVICKDGKRRVIWFERDEEGNGPGCFFISDPTE